MKVEYQIIKRNDNFCKNENLFISLLETNKNYKIKRASTILKYKDLNIVYDIKKYETKEKQEIMFIVCFSLEDESQLEEFEKFDKSFSEFIAKFNNDFSLNTIWDDISKKYAEELYPKIFYIENLLRKIIYYFMGKNVGNTWTKKCFPKDVENSIKDVKNKNQAETDENILYYADFIQLSYLLFIKYPNALISQDKFIEKLKDKKYNIYEMVSEYEYKSNWDRYFEPVVRKKNLEDNLKKLYYYRNLVAHNRKIRQTDKKNAESLISKIKEVLDGCLRNINKINVPEEEKENLENISYQIFYPSKYEIENNTLLTSALASMKMDSNMNSALTSVTDSMKKYLEINPAITSVTDSMKKYLEINPAITSVTDTMKKYLEVNPITEKNYLINNGRTISTKKNTKEKPKDKK